MEWRKLVAALVTAPRGTTRDKEILAVYSIDNKSQDFCCSSILIFVLLHVYTNKRINNKK